MDKKKKKYAEMPLTVNEHDGERLRRLSARKSSIVMMVRALTETLEDVTFRSWGLWDKIIESYNLDPKKDYYSMGQIIYERKRAFDP